VCHECSAPSEKKAPKQQCKPKKAPVDEVLREIVHDALSHSGDQTLDETITRKVMHGVEELTTSGRIVRMKGPKGKRKCKHCEAGWSKKQSTKQSGVVHKTPPKGEGTDISADVIGPFRQSVEGYIYMLVIVDMETKFLYIRGLKDQREMHERFAEYCALMKRLNKKYRRVHLKLSKMTTDSAINLMCRTMKEWQRIGFIVD